jgi:hypothetical protein
MIQDMSTSPEISFSNELRLPHHEERAAQLRSLSGYNETSALAWELAKQPFFPLLGECSLDIVEAMVAKGMNREEITAVFVDSLSPRRSHQTWMEQAVALGPDMTVCPFGREYKTPQWRWGDFVKQWRQMTTPEQNKIISERITAFIKILQDPEEVAAFDKREIGRRLVETALGGEGYYYAIYHTSMRRLGGFSGFFNEEERKGIVRNIFGRDNLYTVLPYFSQLAEFAPADTPGFKELIEGEVMKYAFFDPIGSSHGLWALEHADELVKAFKSDPDFTERILSIALHYRGKEGDLPLGNQLSSCPFEYPSEIGFLTKIRLINLKMEGSLANCLEACPTESRYRRDIVAWILKEAKMEDPSCFLATTPDIDCLIQVVPTLRETIRTNLEKQMVDARKWVEGLADKVSSGGFYFLGGREVPRNLASIFGEEELTRIKAEFQAILSLYERKR